MDLYKSNTNLPARGENNMGKTDFKKELAHLYKVRKGNIAEIEVPAMNFLMIDGQGNPNQEGEFGKAIKALYALSYAIKFHIKNGNSGIDYGVLPLEGLWWADDMEAYKQNRKDEWKWTLMIMQPEFVSRNMVESMRNQLTEKKHIPALSSVRFEEFEEGLCAQNLHIGPFSEEGPSLEKLHSFIEERGELSGKHHEIYLSDTRRAAPENWKTILRQPFKSTK